MLFHAGIFTISKSQSYMSILITKNTLHQLNLEGKKCNTAFLGDKNFTKDKNGNRPLDKGIGRITMKIPHPLNNIQLK